MPDADKMFEELGYEKDEFYNLISYIKHYDTHTAVIEFDTDKKLI